MLGLAIITDNDKKDKYMARMFLVGDYRDPSRCGDKIIEINKAIQVGTNLKTKDQFGWTLLMHAVCYWLPKKTIKLLIAKGSDVNAKDNGGWTPLVYALVYSDRRKSVIELLIDKGADVNVKDDDGETPLMLYISKNIAQLLIEKGAKLDLQDKKGHTALMRAIDKGNRAIVKLLIEKGAKLDLQDKKGHTASMHAIDKGNRDIVKLLLKTDLKQQEQKLNKSEQKNANLEKLVAELQTQINVNKWKTKKEHQNMLRVALLRRHIHK